MVNQSLNWPLRTSGRLFHTFHWKLGWPWLTILQWIMDGIADYSSISELQTTYIQRSTTALNWPICLNGKCKKMTNQLSDLKCKTLVTRSKISLRPLNGAKLLEISSCARMRECLRIRLVKLRWRWMLAYQLRKLSKNIEMHKLRVRWVVCRPSWPSKKKANPFVLTGNSKLARWHESRRTWWWERGWNYGSRCSQRALRS